ncbi:MAG TPA: hypothetical protein PL069_05260 [Saprospiraceae bacterium]|nr:MAG: RimK-like ATP-grasp domain protein [Bacteroidetes bacterium ADurb.Bin145]HQP76795.1 hypothetical protein [Saprospiraceae bacterium]
MRIAIHHSKISYSERWISYCKENQIPFKIVNCYDSDIVRQLDDCDALMWHHYHMSQRDILFAKQLLYSLEMAGKVVFPDFRTGWHFDDKLGQKYLLEAINAPLVPSHVFYTINEAKKWADNTFYPKVFKLRRGSASSNVRLVRSRAVAHQLINKAFGKGFEQYDAWHGLKERWRLFKSGKVSCMEVLEGFARLVYPIPYTRVLGKERGYAYFQDFIPDNTHDIRVNFVADKCFATRRGVRPGDFRASGSWIVDLDVSHIPKEAIKIAFEVSSKLKLQTAAFDFVLHNDKPLIVEVSYGFGFPEGLFKQGFWDSSLTYHPGEFNPFGWIVEDVISSIKAKKDKTITLQ